MSDDAKAVPTVVILNQYYVPDVASTGHLLHELATQFAREGIPVKVTTCFPSYGPPETWQPCPAFERTGGVEVRRMRTTRFSKDNLLGRMLNSMTEKADSFCGECASLVCESSTEYFVNSSVVTDN